MTEMEEIKTTLADINKKLDRVILQNKIAMNTVYGSPVKQEKDSEYPVYIIQHKAIKDFIFYLKSKSYDYYGDNLFKYMEEFERIKPAPSQEKDNGNVVKAIRHQAITDFLYFVKHKEVGVYAPVIKTFVTSYERLLKSLEEFEFNEEHMQDL